MKVILKDGKELDVENGSTGAQIASKISTSLLKEAIAVSVDGDILDLSQSIDGDNRKIAFITKNDKEAMDIINHSAAHLLAQAVLSLYPNAQLAFGPSIEEGFFYDILFDTPISENDFLLIEKKMRELANMAYSIVRTEVSKSEAKKIFKNQKFKLEHIDEVEGPISIYTQGDFSDLCRGPHVKHTGLLKNFKILSLAGAYYKGDQKNVQLTRIYGTCFFTADDLKKHLDILEQRKLSDHRRIGKQMGLFMLSDYGPGFPFFLPNGMILRRELENYWYKIHEDNGYLFINTPIILSRELWETSGHWKNYKENMYTTVIDDKDYAIKPMSCPGGLIVYNSSIHSYRDLPLRLGEMGHVHRHEASGALAGLFRVRSFTQDDAHIFATLDQLKSEIKSLLALYDEIYKVFDLKYSIVLSTRPENKYIGSIEVWNKSEQILRECLEEVGVEYKINEGDGAFYGPKLDFKLKDSMNRIWQCGTIQLDMNLPERFDISYIDADGTKKRPVMLHRAILGSIERFIGIITEHFKGAFPTWLAPEQVRIIPINSVSHIEYANKIAKTLKDNNIRVKVDSENEKLNYKIRNSQTMKVPYTLILGDNEMNENLISYRLFGQQKTNTISIDEFVSKITEDIKNKKTYRD